MRDLQCPVRASGVSGGGRCLPCRRTHGVWMGTQSRRRERNRHAPTRTTTLWTLRLHVCVCSYVHVRIENIDSHN